MKIDQKDQIVPETGNTLKQSPLFTYWFFTLNNYDLDQIDQIDQVFRHECDWFIFQEEVGDSTGTPHLQGTIKLKKKQRLTALKKWNDKIHWEPTKSVKASIEYCTKERTRSGKQWVYGINLPKPIKVCEPYGWQLEVLDIIKEEPDIRTIHWFWEPTGNVGKSTLCKYLYVKHNAIVVGGKSADIFYAITVRVDQHKEVRIVIIDIPRVQLDFVNFGAIEQVKNGLFFSGKYKSKSVAFDPPHVICFANSEPHYDYMSKDRWNVRRISI